MSENQCEDCVSRAEIARYDSFKRWILGLLLLLLLLALLAPVLANFYGFGNGSGSRESESEQMEILQGILEQLQQQDQRQNIDVSMNINGLPLLTPLPPPVVVETVTPPPDNPPETITPETVTPETEPPDPTISPVAEVTRVVTEFITAEPTIITVTVPVTVTQPPIFIERVETRVFVEVPPTPTGFGSACTRFNFEVGREMVRGSRGSGWYVMFETSGRAVTSWYAQDGWLDSGLLENLAISADTVYVTVSFYPDAGGQPIPMEIINHAPNLPYGWIANGICHATEIQFPPEFSTE